MRTVVSRYRVATGLLAVLVAAYVGYYVAHVPQPFSGSGRPVLADLLGAMVARSFLSGVWGGPWRWSRLNPPVGYADPPTWALVLAGALTALVVLHAFLVRTRTLRAWALLAGYLAALVALVATTRAPVAGGAIGLELRYLTDVTCVLVLCLGLVFLPLTGAVESSAPREEPLLTLRVRPVHAAGLVVAVCVCGLVSSASYARIWHSDNPGERYVHRFRADLLRAGPVDLADQVVPADVVPGFSYPANTTGRLVPLVDPRVRFPSVTSRLAVLAQDGGLHPALVDPFARSEPGPVDGCGWVLTGAGRDIPLDRVTPGFAWWVRIGYLASARSPVTVRAGGRTVETEVRRGAHSLYWRSDRVFDTVRVGGLSEGTTVCVDTIEVGDVVPAEGQVP